MNQAVIALGSNIDPQHNIRKARSLLAETFAVTAESRFVKTMPVGYPNQPPFLNGVLLLQTELDLDALKLQIKAMETALGRRRSPFKFGPRTIDLDLVVWNNRILDQDVYTRDFLKQSIKELLPDLKIEPCSDIS